MPPKKKIVGLKIKDLLEEEKRENSGTENGHEDGYDSLLLVRVTDSMLTKSELAVLYLLAKGLQHKEIAYKYNLSINTVKCHKANIYRKLKVVNLIEAIITYNKYIRSLSDPIL